ncbi:MAG: DUF881 domain-containing protein [Fimbriimonadaceae bacterium]|nr:DUF881 domain-containing protein [Fimbriimonadaceae bacterium]QOJ12788.1 MAG: DUF881 domain-containing protein [Chthonomonadaceae bacterium]
MNPFARTLSGSSWILPVSAVAFVLGFFIMLAWIPKEDPGRLALLDASQRDRLTSARIDVQFKEEYERMSAEVKKLREEKTRLENAIGDQTKQAEVLNETLQDTKMFAGLLEVEGPGILITLRDSERASRGGIPEGDLVIHDTDVLRVVNELWAASAEAVSVNNHRVVGSSSFRCVGPVIHVDNVPISTPVRIRAIGDPEVLYGAMNLRLGVLDEIRNSGDPTMVQMEAVEKQRIPAYAGPTARKFAMPRPAEP